MSSILCLKRQLSLLSDIRYRRIKFNKSIKDINDEIAYLTHLTSRNKTNKHTTLKSHRFKMVKYIKNVIRFYNVKCNICKQLSKLNIQRYLTYKQIKMIYNYIFSKEFAHINKDNNLIFDLYDNINSDYESDINIKVIDNNIYLNVDFKETIISDYKLNIGTKFKSIINLYNYNIRSIFILIKEASRIKEVTLIKLYLFLSIFNINNIIIICVGENSNKYISENSIYFDRTIKNITPDVNIEYITCNDIKDINLNNYSNIYNKELNTCLYTKFINKLDIYLNDEL